MAPALPAPPRQGGVFEPADFALVLILYALSGARTLRLFFFLLAPFATLFARAVGRRTLPKASALSRFLEDCTDEAVETVRELLFRDLLAHGLRGASLGGLFDRTGATHVFIDVDGTRLVARQRALRSR